MSRFRPRLTYSNVTASLALFIALGGTSYAVTKLPKNSVGSEQVRNGTIKRVDLGKDVVQQGATGARGPRGAVGPEGPTGPANVGRESWQNIALAAPNWTAYNNTETKPQFRKDAAGIVRLRGFITKPGGTPTRPEQMGVLPPGYRPQQQEYFSAAAGYPDGVASFAIFPDGQLVWLSGPTGEPDFVNFSGVTFTTD